MYTQIVAAAAVVVAVVAEFVVEEAYMQNHEVAERLDLGYYSLAQLEEQEF